MQTQLTFFDIVLFSFMIVGFVIGIHQSILTGVANSYWLFMLSSLSFLWLNHRIKNKKEGIEKQNSVDKTAINPKKPKSKK